MKQKEMLFKVISIIAIIVGVISGVLLFLNAVSANILLPLGLFCLALGAFAAYMSGKYKTKRYGFLSKLEDARLLFIAVFAIFGLILYFVRFYSANQ